MTEAMPFLQKAILLSYDPRPFGVGHFFALLRAGGAARSRAGLCGKENLYTNSIIITIGIFFARVAGNARARAPCPKAYGPPLPAGWARRQRRAAARAGESASGEWCRWR